METNPLILEQILFIACDYLFLPNFYSGINLCFLTFNILMLHSRMMSLNWRAGDSSGPADTVIIIWYRCPVSSSVQSQA